MKAFTTLILISMLVSVSFIISIAFAYDEPFVGVKEGDWIEYSVSVSGTGVPPPTHDVRWFKIEVLPVQGAAFSVNLTARYANGTIDSAIWKFNFTEGNVEGWIIIPSNLGLGETFYDYSPHTGKPVNITIHRQEQKTVLGASRTVTYGNDSLRHKEWDKVTGVFVASLELYRNVTTRYGWHIEDLTVTVQAIATNMWSSELIFGLNQTVFYAMVGASAAGVLLLMSVSIMVFAQRKKKESLTSSSSSKERITALSFVIVVILAWVGAFTLTYNGLNSSEINLAMQTFWTALVLVSMWFRARGDYLVHEVTMILVVFSALISFAGVLLMSPPSSGSMDMYFSSPLNLAAFMLHAIFSIPALFFGAWLVVIYRPSSISFAAKSKRIAQITAVTWVMSYVAGLFTFMVYHTALFG